MDDICNESPIDEGVFNDRYSKWCGSAKVDLRFLAYTEAKHDARWIDEKNVERLIQIFHLEGCHRLDLENHVPVLISEEQLHQALSRAHLARQDLLNLNEFPFITFEDDIRLICIHGKHRLIAADKFLCPSEKWWVVDLYIDGLLPQTVRDIAEEYANSKNFCDGDIFRNIRHHQRNDNTAQATKWLARLSEGKRQDLKRLRKADDLTELRLAFDKLLPFTGLWPALQIGTFHRLLALKCPEELCHYLEAVFQTWDIIFFHDESLRPLLDAGTVSSLQMRWPKYSLDDRIHIESLMQDRRIFPAITSRFLRCRILGQLQNIRYRILSLYTFLEDTKYLEPAAFAMKRLLPPKFKGSVRSQMRMCYTGRNQSNGKLECQVSEYDFQEQNINGLEGIQIDLRTDQLFLYSFRHFPEMSGINPRKDNGKPKPPPQTICEESVVGLAKLAQRLGFESLSIGRVAGQNPDAKALREFILKLRPPDLFDTSLENMQHILSSFTSYLESIKPRMDPVRPLFSSNNEREGEPIAHRCGRPFEQSHLYDRRFLFISNVYDNSLQLEKRFITSFAIKVDIFQAFFGRRWNWPTCSSMASRSPRNDQGIIQTPHNRNVEEATPVESSANRVSSQPSSIGITNHGRHSISPIASSSDKLIYAPGFENYPNETPLAPIKGIIVSGVSTAERLQSFWNTEQWRGLSIIKPTVLYDFHQHMFYKVIDEQSWHTLISTYATDYFFLIVMKKKIFIMPPPLLRLSHQLVFVSKKENYHDFSSSSFFHNKSLELFCSFIDNLQIPASSSYSETLPFL
ncbi:MAG: hypothetical protein M1834_000929 [Cirrosporium novae-zelandiae]|nr:MAG: hypothetical protein M1834_000929 [Cirrosporium novae-zelandiae]